MLEHLDCFFILGDRIQGLRQADFQIARRMTRKRLPDKWFRVQKTFLLAEDVRQ